MRSSASQSTASECDDEPMVSATQERMSDLDTLVWNIERDPRLTSTVTGILMFDDPIEPADLHRQLQRSSRIVPRLHQRVVNDSLPMAPPRWEVDPDLALAFHLRITTLGGQGTLGQLHDLAAAIAAQPLNRSRPLWELTLVRGMADSGCALVVKTHHALTDGVGSMELMLELFDLEPGPPARHKEIPPCPPAPDPAAGSIDSELRYEAQQILRTIAATCGIGAQALSDPFDAARRLGAAIGSAQRILSPVPAPLSSVIEGRSLDLELRSFSVALADMKAAGKRIDGTVNDAFVAAIALGISSYHRRFGSSIDSLRVSIPVNRRVAGDSVGNHFTPGKIRLDTDTVDTDELMRRAHREVILLRHEPANDLISPIAGVLRFLPAAVSTSIASALFVGIDVAASNVPGSQVPLYLCGRRLSALIPFGPLVGCAANVTMVSFDGEVQVGVNCDPAAVTQVDDFVDDLKAAFGQVLGPR